MLGENLVDSSDLAEVLDKPSLWVILGFVALLYLQWRRDVSNPSKAASDSVLTDLAEHSTGVFAMFREASDMAQQANKRAAEAERGNLERDKQYAKLERQYEEMRRDYDSLNVKHAATLAYLRTVVDFIVDHDLKPPSMPAEMVD